MGSRSSICSMSTSRIRWVKIVLKMMLISTNISTSVWVVAKTEMRGVKKKTRVSMERR